MAGLAEKTVYIGSFFDWTSKGVCKSQRDPDLANKPLSEIMSLKDLGQCNKAQ